MPRYKLGKLAPKPNLKTIPFHKFLATDAPPPPPEKVYWEYKLPVNNLRMLGNDTVGDCTCACVGHMIMNMTAHTGSILIPTDEEILAFYSAITGYDPSQTDSQGNNPTDTGAAITDVLARWQSDGITIGGQVHKILGWMQFDHTNREQMAQVIYLFGAADCGVVLPNSAMDQFNAGQDWDVVADDGGEDGGHCIPAFGQGGAGDHFYHLGEASGREKCVADQVSRRSLWSDRSGLVRHDRCGAEPFRQGCSLGISKGVGEIK